MATLASTIPSPQPEKQVLVFYSFLVVVLATLLTTSGCSNQTSGATAPAATEVEVADVEQRDVPIYKEWIGTLDGFVNADIKAQVTGYLLEQAYQEGSFVKKGQLLFSNRPTPLSSSFGTGARPAGPVGRTVGASTSRVGTGPSTGGGGGSDSAPHSIGRGSLYSLGAAAGNHATGPRQRDSEQSCREGAGAVRAGASGHRPGSDHRGHRCGSVGQGHRGNGPDQPGIYQAHIAHRRYPGHRAAASRFAGQSGQPDHHHRVDARSDQGLFHRRRAGISRLSQALLDTGHPGR